MIHIKHFGDICKISGYEAPVVNVIIGGSPCQDLSVAGKRAGLAGARSGLFMEQIRIIKEMRKRDVESGRTGNEVRPRFMVWEQVPGVFSSNTGKDFAAVLEEIVRVAEPEAPDIHVPADGWTNTGCIMGRQWSVAWRVLDAQFWGVPQRRRRIALIADFSDRCAPEVLFERSGSEGHFESGEAQGQRAAGDASDRSGTASDESGDSDRGSGRGCLNPWDVQSKHILPDDGVAETLYSAESRWGGSESYVITQSGIKCLNPEDSQSARIYDADGVYHSLNANSGGGQSRDGVLQPIAFAQNQRDEVRDLGDVSGALSAEPGVKQQTYVAIPTSEQTGCLNPEDPQSKRVFHPSGISPTLTSGGETGGMNIVPSVIQKSQDAEIKS